MAAVEQVNWFIKPDDPVGFAQGFNKLYIYTPGQALYAWDGQNAYNLELTQDDGRPWPPRLYGPEKFQIVRHQRTNYKILVTAPVVKIEVIGLPKLCRFRNEGEIITVRVATTTNINLTGAQVIDGVNVVAGNIVLVKNQINKYHNGIYSVQAGAWIRSIDYNTAAEIDELRYSKIVPNEGTQKSKSYYLNIPIEKINVGFTNLIFSEKTNWLGDLDISLLSRDIGFFSFDIIASNEGGEARLRVDVEVVSSDSNISKVSEPTAPTPRKIPRGHIIARQTERLFLAGETQNPDAIYVSDISNNANFPKENMIRTPDAKIINALVSWRNSDIVSFSLRSIHVLSCPSNLPINQWRWTEVSRQVGCLAPKTAVPFGNDIYFLSEAGVNSLQIAESNEQRQLTSVKSAPIDDIIRRINWSQAWKACAISFQDKYFISLPIDGSVEPNVLCVYSSTTQQWFRIWQGFNATAFCVAIFNDRPRLNFINAKGQAYWWFDDDEIFVDYPWPGSTSHIRSEIVSRGLNFNELASPKTGNYFEFQFESSHASQSDGAKIYFKKDGQSTENQIWSGDTGTVHSNKIMIEKIFTPDVSPSFLDSNLHGIINHGEPVYLKTTGTLPAGLLANKQYFAGIINNSTISLHPTIEDAQPKTFTADPNNNLITIPNHQLYGSGFGIKFFTNNTLPTGLTANVTYFANALNENELSIHLNKSDVNFREFTANHNTDTLTRTNHGLQDGDCLRLDTSGVLPAGLTIDGQWFVKWVDANNFKLCASLDDFNNNITFDFTSNGTGFHYYLRVVDIQNAGVGTHTCLTNVVEFSDAGSGTHSFVYSKLDLTLVNGVKSVWKFRKDKEESARDDIMFQGQFRYCQLKAVSNARKLRIRRLGAAAYIDSLSQERR